MQLKALIPFSNHIRNDFRRNLIRHILATVERKYGF